MPIPNLIPQPNSTDPCYCISTCTTPCNPAKCSDPNGCLVLGNILVKQCDSVYPCGEQGFVDFSCFCIPCEEEVEFTIIDSPDSVVIDSITHEGLTFTTTNTATGCEKAEICFRAVCRGEEECDDKSDIGSVTVYFKSRCENCDGACNECTGDCVSTEGEEYNTPTIHPETAPEAPTNSELIIHPDSACVDDITYAILSYDDQILTNVTIDVNGVISYEAVCSDLLINGISTQVVYSATACDAIVEGTSLISINLCADCTEGVCDPCTGKCVHAEDKNVGLMHTEYTCESTANTFDLSNPIADDYYVVDYDSEVFTNVSIAPLTGIITFDITDDADPGRTYRIKYRIVSGKTYDDAYFYVPICDFSYVTCGTNEELDMCTGACIDMCPIVTPTQKEDDCVIIGGTPASTVVSNLTEECDVVGDPLDLCAPLLVALAGKPELCLACRETNGAPEVYCTCTGNEECFEIDGAYQCCEETTWTPAIDPSLVCDTVSITETSNCGTTRMTFGTKSSTEYTLLQIAEDVCSGEVIYEQNECGDARVSAIVGTKDCTEQCDCEDTVWTPDVDVMCLGESYYQTSNCGNKRTAVGTYEPQCPPLDNFFEGVEVLDYCGNSCGEGTKCVPGGDTLCENEAACNNGQIGPCIFPNSGECLDCDGLTTCAGNEICVGGDCVQNTEDCTDDCYEENGLSEPCVTLIANDCDLPAAVTCGDPLTSASGCHECMGTGTMADALQVEDPGDKPCGEDLLDPCGNVITVGGGTGPNPSGLNPADFACGDDVVDGCGNVIIVGGGTDGVGDACDDLDDCTEGSTIQSDCNCGGGTPIAPDDTCAATTCIDETCLDDCGNVIDGTQEPVIGDLTGAGDAQVTPLIFGTFPNGTYNLDLTARLTCKCDAVTFPITTTNLQILDDPSNFIGTGVVRMTIDGVGGLEIVVTGPLVSGDLVFSIDVECGGVITTVYFQISI
jgi:hypothetical protein